ncbi:TPA: hypothetical protein MAL29_005442, partial [Klebsiella variicola]|nr:hypothetical protein [Klebsiella variicola]
SRRKRRLRRNTTKLLRNRQSRRKRRLQRNIIKRHTTQLNRRLNLRHNGQGVKVINRRRTAPVFFQEDIMLQRYRFELLLLLLIVCALFTLRLMFK